MSTCLPNVIVIRWRKPPVTYVEFTAVAVVTLAVGVPEEDAA